MIRKWRNRIIIYAVITVLLSIIGYFLYINIVEINEQMAKLRNEGTRGYAELVKLSQETYTDEGEFKWGMMLPIEMERTANYDGITMYKYSMSDFQEMGGMVEVYYLINESDNSVFCYEAEYVEEFKPWVPGQSIFLWSLAGISFLVAMLYVARQIFRSYVAAKGEESIGTFIEAFRPKLGSTRYYKVKYSFIKDGEFIEAISPAFYDGREVDKLHEFGSFSVKYLGKYSMINERYDLYTRL